MTETLARRFGIGHHELVSIVGAGGKTTLLKSLGSELTGDGRRVILTTTTRMARDQVTEPVCWSREPADVEAALTATSPLFVMSGVNPDKAVGLEPEAVDRLFCNTSVDHVLVEADGARTMAIKAPAVHEPVIPRLTTLVIVVVGANALGKPLTDVAHRPERIANLTGTTVDSIVTVDLAAAVLLHPEGGLKSIPENARLAMAITRVQAKDDAAEELATILADHPSVDRVVTVPVNGRPLLAGSARC